MANRPGYIYVLSNPSFPGQVKVGRTERNPNDRIRELSSATGVPTPFELAFYQHFEDCHAAEENAHKAWEKVGLRTNNGREFFHVSVEEAVRTIKRLAAIEQKSADPEIAKALLIKGRNLLFGSATVMRDTALALENLEQAAAMGSIGASFFAGRAAHRLAEERPRDKTLGHRAMGHLQTAIAGGHANACAWATWVFRANNQHREADNAWALFLIRTDAAGGPKGEALTWILNWVERDVQAGKALADPFLTTHRDVLIAGCGDARPAAKQALARLGQPWWMSALFKGQDVVVPMVKRHPASIASLLVCLGLYATRDDWAFIALAVLALVAFVVEQKVRTKAKRAAWQAAARAPARRKRRRT